MFILAFGLTFFVTSATTKSIGVWDIPSKASFKISGDGVPAVIEMYRVWFQNVTTKQMFTNDKTTPFVKTIPCDYRPYRTLSSRYTMCTADGTISSPGNGKSPITSSTSRIVDYEFLHPHRPSTQWSQSTAPPYHHLVSGREPYVVDVTKIRQCMHHGLPCNCPDDSHQYHE